MSIEIDRQMDIPYTNPFNFIIPNSVKGKLTTDDYIFFNIQDIDPRKYNLALESWNGVIRTVGPLERKMRLPNTKFTKYSFVLLLPVEDKLPSFVSILERGHRYDVSLYSRKYKGYFIMQ